MKKLVPPTRHTTQPRHAQERGKAKLEWATVDGVIFHAAQFVGVDPSDRPEGRCQCCDEAIVWKAGDVVLPHVAHRANSTCPSTNPETAEHMNAKAKIAHALTSENALTIASTCSVGHPGSMRWDVAPWAYVQPEYRLGTRRPDVALLTTARDGIAAIEVLHTHAVDKAKASDFAAAGLPWIEVHSSVALGWDEKSPLQIVAADAVTRKGFDAECRSCAETRARKAAEVLRVAAEKERVQRAYLATIALAAQRKAETDLQYAADETERSRLRTIASLKNSRNCLRIAVCSEDVNDYASSFGSDKDYCGYPLQKRDGGYVGAIVMRDGASPRGVRTPTVRCGSTWLALDFALAWLEQTAPRRGALLYIDDYRMERLAHAKHSDEDEVVTRVRAAIIRTGSAVIGNRSDSDWDNWWFYSISSFLGSIEATQRPIEDSDPHVPIRWESWWCAWAAPRRVGADLSRASSIDGGSS